MKNLISWKAITVFLLAGSFFFASCKDKDEATPDKSKILTGGSWKMTALTVDPPIDWFGTTVTNVYAQLPACVKDDETIFHSGGEVHFDEGATKCEETDPQKRTGSWSLSTDHKTLFLTEDGETENWNIENLKSNAFEAQYTSNIEGLNYTFSVTFKKK